MASRHNHRKAPRKTPPSQSPEANRRATGPFRLAALPGLASGYAAAAMVLAVHFLIAAASVREKSNTFDEMAHVTAGYSYWMRNDYRLHPENGNLPQRWLALPLLAMDLKFPDDQAAWAASDVWAIGNRFFFKLGNDLESLLWRARCTNVILSVGLGFLVYAWSRQLFGPGGGMISLLAYAASPTMLANGSLATSDLAAAALFAASVGCLWKMFHKVSPGSLICCWLALAGLFLSKTSALLIVPMSLAMLGIRLATRRPLAIGWKRVVAVDRRIAQAGVLLGILLFQAVLVSATIWVFYGFRYSAFRGPPDKSEHLYHSWDDTLADSGAIGQAIEFARDNRLLPEGFLYGAAYVFKHSQKRVAFINGQFGLTGWWYFFPYTLLVKTPLAMFGLLALAGAGAVWNWRQGRPAERRAFRFALRNAFYATAPLWILMAVYWASAINAKLNIGHRHILPTYPPMFILAGAAVYWLRQSVGWHRATSAAVLVCVFALVCGCFGTYPHYLAYFNQIAGGPGNGYRHLVDSSLDWGQDLPGLKRWLKEHDLEGAGKPPVYLAYFGTADPTYFNISAMELCGDRPRKFVHLTEGWYCISATILQQVYSWVPGHWTPEYEQAYQEALRNVQLLEETAPASRPELIRAKGEAFWQKTIELFNLLRLNRLCAFLRQREPNDNIGYSILIYRLSAADIEMALLGPPPENG